MRTTFAESFRSREHCRRVGTSARRKVSTQALLAHVQFFGRVRHPAAPKRKRITIPTRHQTILDYGFRKAAELRCKTHKIPSIVYQP